MPLTRRGFLAGTTALAASGAASGQGARPRIDPSYRRIAVEEAFLTRDIAAAWDRLVEGDAAMEPGFAGMWRGIGSNAGFRSRLLDVGEGRLKDMDAVGIAMQLLSLTAPGVQVFQPADGTALARDANDELAAAIESQPDRFAGLAAVAPQDPAAAAREIERAMDRLDLNGVVINSHTNGDYLDLPKYWPILEAAEALEAPIYIHPRTPPAGMLEPYMSRGLHGPLGGFAAEVCLHVLAMITAGVFDRFPRLQVVIGHLGEGLPYMMYRLDYMQHHAALPGLRGKAKGTTLELAISDYLKRNVHVTTSGMAWPPAIKFAQGVMGSDRVLYAMDYPYQYDPEEVVATDEAPMSDADKRRLFQDNAEALFGLERIG